MPYKEIASALISIIVVVISDQINNKKCKK